MKLDRKILERLICEALQEDSDFVNPNAPAGHTPFPPQKKSAPRMSIDSAISEIIHSKFNNVMYVNPESQINEKNFKVKIGNNDFIKEIGVNVFDENAKIAYPLYKLSKSSMKIWMKEIDNYIQQDKTNLYGEDAFNNISDKINLMPMYTTDFCMEIDDHEDLLEAKKYYEKNGLK